MLKALAASFGAYKPPVAKTQEDDLTVPPEAMRAMQGSAVSAIAAKAGPRLPVVHGHDKGLPKAPPVFDVEEMKRRNEQVAARIKNRRGGRRV